MSHDWLPNTSLIIKHLSDYKEILESIGPGGEDKKVDEEIVELGIIIGKLYNYNMEIIGQTLTKKYLDQHYYERLGKKRMFVCADPLLMK